MKRTLWIILLGITARTTGAGDEAKSQITSPVGGDRAESRVYKRASRSDLAIHLHFPPDWRPEDHRPAIVFFFGGGWTTGNVRQFEEQAAHLARRGLVAARADYRVRLRHNVTPDKCVEDAKSAVRWLRQHAAELGIDPDKIVAAGGSAGGHIAACASLSKGLDEEGEDLAISSKPNALVLFNPVLSFVDLPRLMVLIASDEALGETMSPILHLSKETPPTLLLYGTDDPLHAQGKAFLERANEVGVRCEMFTAEGMPHGFFNRPPWKDTTLQRVDEFLVSLGYLSPLP